MIEYNDNGYLVPGFHKTTLVDVCSCTVDSFKNSVTRNRNWQSFINVFLPFLDKLDLKIKCIWINGSFSTQKVDPNDIDGIVFVDIDLNITEINNYITKVEQFKKLSDYFRNIYCDFYLMLSDECIKKFLESSNPEFVHFGQKLDFNYKYWMGQFSFDRNRVPKGVFEVSIKGGKS